MWQRWAGLLAVFSWAWWLIKKWWFWQALSWLLVILFIVVWVRPSAKPTPDKDVATAWNEGINRFGILPIFPPAEDIYVGDLLAVVSDSAGKPVRSTAVRINHLNLRKEMKDANKDHPIFPESAEAKEANKFPHQDNKDVVDSPCRESGSSITKRS
jgi:hypothetical protein